MRSQFAFADNPVGMARKGIPPCEDDPAGGGNAQIPVMSGRRPVVKGCFEAVVNASGAVMSSASHEGSSVNSFLPMAIRGELSFPQGIPC